LRSMVAMGAALAVGGLALAPAGAGASAKVEAASRISVVPHAQSYGKFRKLIERALGEAH